MNFSGVLVVCPVGAIDPMITALEELSGVEVHHTDRRTGRIVVTLEADSIRAEVEGLGRIKALPNVILAEMVYHRFEDDPELAVSGLSAPTDESPSAVPPFLND